MFIRVTNYDERNLGVKSGFDHLHFESRFECGNLRKAIKVSSYQFNQVKKLFKFFLFTSMSVCYLDRYQRV